nr:unnamed protein product [Callosobruchus analis]
MRRMKHELRCHAVLCSTAAVAKQIEAELKQSIALALLEFKRDKLSRQNARLSLVNSVYENPTLPRRKILLSTGPHNYNLLWSGPNLLPSSPVSRKSSKKKTK